MFTIHGHWLPGLASFSSLSYSIKMQWAKDKSPYQMILLSVFNSMFVHKESAFNIWRNVLGYSYLLVISVKVALVTQVKFTFPFYW